MKKRYGKLFALLLAVVMVLSLVGCGTTPKPTGKVKIGISMPTKSLQRWIQDGEYLVQEFEKAGFECDLQYAGDNVIAEQVAQIENMIAIDCKVLVIVAIDAKSLSGVLEAAIEKEIAVFAYDRLIVNTDAVTYYSTFDNVKVGAEQAKFIVKALDLDNAAGPFNIEIFTGDPADTNAFFFYKGAMDVMKPYIDAGKVKILSGQVEQLQTATDKWNAELAQARMEDLIASVGYGPTSGKKLDAVLCSNDSTAQGAITALVANGWDATNIPVITGQDCDKPNVTFMLQGLQAVSIFKDTRTLAKQTVKMVVQYLNGEKVDVNDTTTYNNGNKDIDSFLSDPVPCTVDEIISMLFDSGYYTWDDPKLAEAAKIAEALGIKK